MLDELSLRLKGGWMMRVKYIGESENRVLTNGKIYDVVGIEKGWYRVVDDSNEDYLYPPQIFEIIET